MYLILSITFLMRQFQINRIHPFLYKIKFSELNFLVIVNNFLESNKERKPQS